MRFQIFTFFLVVLVSQAGGTPATRRVIQSSSSSRTLKKGKKGTKGSKTQKPTESTNGDGKDGDVSRGCAYDYTSFDCDGNCLPSIEFFCEDGLWVFSDPPTKPCGAIRGSCNPEECPFFKPEPGSKCKDTYKGKEDCFYEYKSTGCDSKTCEPTEIYTCDTESDEWLVAVFIPELCEDGTDSIGESCNPEPEKCPFLKPVSGSKCKDTYTGKGDCFYDYRSYGCDTKTCSPFEFYSCDTELDEWLVAVVDPIPCEDGKNSVGESCNPELEKCPILKPVSGSKCKDTYKGKEDCFYEYKSTGCDSITCEPTEIYTCDTESDEWLLAVFIPELCKDGTDSIGELCNPELEKCPILKPVSGSKCKDTFTGRGDCFYDYRSYGCDTKTCSPFELYSCDTELDEWLVAVVDPIPCEDGTNSVGESCVPPDVEYDTNGCPVNVPQAGTSCVRV